MKVTHYSPAPNDWRRDWIACGVFVGHKRTKNKKQVTCKNCLRAINKKESDHE